MSEQTTAQNEKDERARRVVMKIMAILEEEGLSMDDYYTGVVPRVQWQLTQVKIRRP